MASFLDSLDPEDRVNVEKYRTEILKIDTKVKEKVSKIMSIENALVYEQDGVFKYGLQRQSTTIRFIRWSCMATKTF